MKLAKGRERNELCFGDRKQQELHFTPSGFFRDIDVNLREKKKENIFEHSNLSLCTSPRATFLSSRLLQRQFACVHEKKKRTLT